jgi:hypothetical protein
LKADCCAREQPGYGKAGNDFFPARKGLLARGKSLLAEEILNSLWEKTFWAREKSFGRGNTQFRSGKDFLGLGKVFSSRERVNAPGKRPFAWSRKSFRRRIDHCRGGKGLFPVPSQQFRPQKAFWAGRKVFCAAPGIKDG